MHVSSCCRGWSRQDNDNRVHPYTSWIPITLWVVLRNVTPSMRHLSLSLFGWLGCITLETYISQFHTWLATGIPNGQPKMLLTFFPQSYPLLNFAASTAGTPSLLLVVLKSQCGYNQRVNITKMAFLLGPLHFMGAMCLVQCHIDTSQHSCNAAYMHWHYV